MIGSTTYELDRDWGKLPKGYEFHQVAGVAVDADDQVYAFNRSSHQVLVLSREGALVRVWGQSFGQPHGVSVGADGNVYFADRNAHAVFKYSPDEVPLLTLGTLKQPSETRIEQHGHVVNAAGPFNMPTGVAVGRQGDIFVSDGYGNSRVHKYNSTGTLIKSWGFPGKVKPGNFNLPHGIGIDGQGRLLVCDRENHRIQFFTQDAEYLDMWTGFRQPTDVHVGPDGTVYVSELQNRVTILDGDGDVIGRWGGEKSHEPGQFVAPHGIAIDSHGDIYVGEVLEFVRT